MPYHESPSPAIRPQLTERSSSTHSLPRASPSTGKGSSTRLHKQHAIGHGRHAHGRIPSYGRNMNKLSKLTAAHTQEEHARPKDQSNGKARTPSTSPSTGHMKHNTSNANLQHTSSKVTIKRNASNLSQKRNKSLSKLGNVTKTDKAQRKTFDKKKVDDTQFSVGSDEEDEGWTEADSSQSPEATRPSSTVNGQTQARQPPSPDGPPLRSPTHLPASPPQSPPITAQQQPDRGPRHRPEPGNSYSRPPDAEMVTNRLLSRNTAQNAKPQTSAISATTTPSGSSGSPAFNFSQDATLRNDQSMPSDGISRFLNATGSSSGNTTPASLSHHLNSALAEIHKDPEHQDDHPPAPSERNAPTNLPHQVRSTPNLTSSNQSQSTSATLHNQQSTQPTFGPSPFTAMAGRKGHPSRTQEKLNLQRDAAKREPPHAPAVQPPSSGAYSDSNEVNIAQKQIKAWERAESEYENARRFLGILGKGIERLDKRGKVSGGGGKEKGRDGAGRARGERNIVVGMGTSAESRPESRGRVRFEVGRGSPGDDEVGDMDGESDGGGVEGLLRRTWEGDGQSGEH
ncbi:MAG: hypothetical protein LQ338_007282 [Usnochroma carphineum]|nr:MAG: hypothetical protein LQ338_007282 [Usnochroma carphineum]